jgi:hypothetical protein
VNGLFLRERTKTSRNVTISFSQSPERATATRGRVQLVFEYNKSGNSEGQIKRTSEEELSIVLRFETLYVHTTRLYFS